MSRPLASRTLTFVSSLTCTHPPTYPPSILPFQRPPRPLTSRPARPRPLTRAPRPPRTPMRAGSRVCTSPAPAALCTCVRAMYPPAYGLIYPSRCRPPCPLLRQTRILYLPASIDGRVGAARLYLLLELRPLLTPARSGGGRRKQLVDQRRNCRCSSLLVHGRLMVHLRLANAIHSPRLAIGFGELLV